jgi:hypothetical protein
MCNLIIQFAFEVGLRLFKMGINEKVTLLVVQIDQQSSKIYSLFISYLKVYVLFVKHCKSILYEIKNNSIVVLKQLNKHIYYLLNILKISNKLVLIYIGSSVQQRSFQPHFFTSLNQFDERI